MKKIYLIRHGQTDYNKEFRIQGSGIDSSLNATGQKQALSFFTLYKHIPFDRIYTSCLKRSHQSVQNFIDLNIEWQQYSGLNEISWGVREGKKIIDHDKEMYNQIIQQWQSGQTNIAFEGGESPKQVADRQKPIIDLIRNQTDEQNILICMHGRAMRIFLCQLMNYPISYMDMFGHTNLCLYKIALSGNLFSIEIYNQPVYQL